MLCEDFHSGDDIALGFLGRTYRFSRRDFGQRVVRAAVDLALVDLPLARAEREDLVTAAIEGSLAAPRSDVGERIAELQAAGGDDPVYALKEIVVAPANSAQGLDPHQGSVLLHDGVTGQLLAVLNASPITEIRTAAVRANVPCITTVPGLAAAVQGIEAARAIGDGDLVDVRGRQRVRLANGEYAVERAVYRVAAGILLDVQTRLFQIELFAKPFQ